MVGKLRDTWNIYLSQIAYEVNNSTWSQEWKSVVTLGLEGEEAISKNSYISSLKNCHIRLKDQHYEMMWSRNLMGGKYTPRLWYLVSSDEDDK